MSTGSSTKVVADFGAWGWPHWLGVTLSLVITGINAWLGYAYQQPPLLLVAGSFLFGVVLFATRFWRPVLYLLGVVHVGGLFVLWLLGGVQFLGLGLVVGACSLALAALGIYLFATAEPSAHW